jgi:hypothetical protein
MANPQIEVEIGAKIKSLFDSLNDAEGALQKFAGKAQKIGTALSLAITTPLLLIGTASLKAASDGEETASKFETVFKSIQAQAEISFKSLRNEFGLSSTASKQLLGDTGDLLTGFGFSQTAALDLATQVAKLGVDLASFTNFSGGAEGASQALTKALLGERESVKALGISILEEDVKKQVAINTAKGLTFETERQAKAYATLDIALSQSKNAIGDFSRTSDQFANQQRIARARIEEVGESLGKVLLPLATRIAGIIIKAADSFNQLSDGTKEIVVIIGALAASIGPVLIGIGTLIKILPFLGAAFTALTGPIGIVVTAVAIGTAAIILNWEEVQRKVKVATLGVIDTFISLLNAINVVASAIPGFSAVTTGAILALEVAGRNLAKSIVDDLGKKAVDALDDFGNAIDNIPPKVKQTFEEFSKLQDIANEKIFRQFAEEANAFNKELDETIRLAKAIESINFSGFQTTAKFDDDGQIIEGTRKKIKLLETPIIEFDIKIGDPPFEEIADRIIDINKFIQTSAQESLGSNPFSFLVDSLFELSELTKIFTSDSSLEDKLDAVRQKALVIGDVFTSLGGIIGNAFKGANQKLGQFLSAFITFAGQLIARAFAVSKANAIVGATAAGAATGPAAPFVTPALIAAGIGVVAAAFSGIGSGGGRGNVGTSGVGAGSSFTGTGGTGFSAERNINLVGSFRIAGSDLLYVIDQSNQARI